jgi:hypothetical protein
MDALKGFPDRVVIIFLFSSMEQIYLKIVGSIPCLPAACVKSSEVLSKAPSVLRNGLRANSIYSIAPSMRVTTL